MNKKEEQIEIINLVKRQKENQDLEEDIETYTVNKEKRVTNKKISQKNTKKKQISTKTFIASMILVSGLTSVGMMQHVGTRLIVDKINKSNIEQSNIDVNRTSNGFIFYEIYPDNSRVELDVDEYLENLNQRGQEAGFSVDEMSIYVNDQYGVSHLLEGTTFLGRMKEKLNTYQKFSLGYGIEEGRYK